MEDAEKNSSWRSLITNGFYRSRDRFKKHKQLQKSEIEKEKERFIYYYVATEIICSKGKNTVQIANGLSKLDQYILSSPESLSIYYNTLEKSIQTNEAAQLKKHAAEIFNALLLGSLDNISKQGNINQLIPLYFTFLCKIDAAITINSFLNNVSPDIKATSLPLLFRYPCVNTIKTILTKDINLNEKIWIIEEKDRMHFTPLMSSIFCLLEKKNVYASKEIISLLLEYGAETNVPVFFSDEDGEPTDYDKQCIPIEEYCERLLSEEPGLFENSQDGETMKEVITMIATQNKMVKSFMSS